MSLIQEALEKTNHAPLPRLKNLPPKLFSGDPMGALLEKKLLRVQKEHARRRTPPRHWVIAGTLLACALGALFYFWDTLGKREIFPGNAPAVVKVRPAGRSASVRPVEEVVKVLPAVKEDVTLWPAEETVTVESAEVVSSSPSVPEDVSFQLTGITKSGGKTMALINGQIVGAGDSLPGGAVVRSIGDRVVFLNAGGKKIRLEL